MTLSSRQRSLLSAVAVLGFLGPNVILLYFALFRWEELVAALQHPITLAFVIEALVVRCLLAVFLARKPEGTRGWKLFIAMSLVGGLGFSVPALVVINSDSRKNG